MNKNIDPNFVTQECIMAKFLFSFRYSQERGGQVDFYERLSPGEKKTVQECVDEILACKRRAQRAR
jgi:hypothetical protein